MKKLYREIFESLKESDSILDLGCGNKSPLGELKGKIKTVGIDSYVESKVHDKFIKGNVLKLEKYFSENEFDCVIALDLIEHLTKEEGKKLLKDMEKIAKKKIIIYTPNGFVEQNAFDGNPFQIHKSGWKYNEMQKLGFRVIGMRGWKWLKGKQDSVRFRPKILFNYISMLTQPLVRNNPKYAYQILCVKDLHNH